MFSSYKEMDSLIICGNRFVVDKTITDSGLAVFSCGIVNFGSKELMQLLQWLLERLELWESVLINPRFMVDECWKLPNLNFSHRIADKKVGEARLINVAKIAKVAKVLSQGYNYTPKGKCVLQKHYSKCIFYKLFR